MDSTYSYAAEKFGAARRTLMLPHPRGEAASLASCFHECHLGLDRLDLNRLDDSARAWVATVREAMDTSGIVDQAQRGTWNIRAEQLTEAEKWAFSAAVDELAYWFDRGSHWRD